MKEKRRVIALGFFDGVHLGHGALLRQARERAEELGAVSAALTFDHHPEEVILGRQSVPLITSPADRADLMRRMYGIPDIIVAHFDQRMMRMDWRAFVSEFLVKEHGAVHLVAGHDHHFGYKGEGNPGRLKDRCIQLGIGCDIVPKVVLDGITVSSSYIRSLIAQGEMERAMEFLGHPYTMSGSVAHGRRLGTTLGFPTVNLIPPPGVIVPAFGVYATRVWVDGQPFLAVTNVGVRPTVEDSTRVTVEGFILDFSGDLYGRELRMEFFRHLRGEQRFPSLEALREEVMRNARQTRDYFAALDK